MIIKAEVVRRPEREARDNPRLVVTNINRVPPSVYDKIYCRRALIENRINCSVACTRQSVCVRVLTAWALSALRTMTGKPAETDIRRSIVSGEAMPRVQGRTVRPVTANPGTRRS